MTASTSAAAAAAASPASPPASPASPPASPASPPASPASPPASPASPPASPPASGAFVMPKDLTDWGANKGYNAEQMTKYATESPELYKMMTSYRETERSLHAATGADKIMVPKDVSDFTQVAPALEKLGAPAKAADYQLQVPAGLEKGIDAFKEIAATNKLLPAQANNLLKWVNDTVTGHTAAETARIAKEGQDSILQLEREWAGNVKVNSEIASRGFNKLAEDLGMSKERADAIRNGNNVTLTAYEFAKLTKSYGDLSKVGGDSFEGAGPGQGGAGGAAEGTPEGAKAEINRLLSDATFAKKYLAKDAEAVKKMDSLYVAAAKGGITSAA